jgi:hypothetical protein
MSTLHPWITSLPPPKSVHFEHIEQLPRLPLSVLEDTYIASDEELTTAFSVISKVAADAAECDRLLQHLASTQQTQEAGATTREAAIHLLCLAHPQAAAGAPRHGVSRLLGSSIQAPVDHSHSEQGLQAMGVACGFYAGALDRLLSAI